MAQQINSGSKFTSHVILSSCTYFLVSINQPIHPLAPTPTEDCTITKKAATRKRQRKNTANSTAANASSASNPSPKKKGIAGGGVTLQNSPPQQQNMQPNFQVANSW